MLKAEINKDTEKCMVMVEGDIITISADLMILTRTLREALKESSPVACEMLDCFLKDIFVDCVLADDSKDIWEVIKKSIEHLS